MYKLKEAQIRLYLSEEKGLYSKEEINHAEDAVKLMSEHLKIMDREYCIVINLDNANHPINFNVISIGDTDHSLVPVKSIFKSALLSNASRFIMLHNHPGGTLKFSKEDQKVTERVIEAGKMMELPLLDHIIVAGMSGECCSIREKMPDLF